LTEQTFPAAAERSIPRYLGARKTARRRKSRPPFLNAAGSWKRRLGVRRPDEHEGVSITISIASQCRGRSREMEQRRECRNIDVSARVSELRAVADDVADHIASIGERCDWMGENGQGRRSRQRER